VDEYILPNNLTFSQALNAAGRSLSGQVKNLGLVYRPVLLAQAYVRYARQKYNLDHEVMRTAIVEAPNPRGRVIWDDYPTPAVEPRQLGGVPDPQARFATLEAPLSDASLMSSMKKDFQDWVYRVSEVNVRANPSLKVYAGPNVSAAEFRKMCSEAARQERDEELRKVDDSFDKKLKRIEDKIEREQRELDEDKSDLAQRRMEEMGTHAENVLRLFSKRSSSVSRSLSKRRMTERAKADVEESEDALIELAKDYEDMAREKAEALEEINERWGEIANEIEEIGVMPYKKDIMMDLFGVAWFPYYIVQFDREITELPGYYLK
jgi:hypothetical protein